MVRRARRPDRRPQARRPAIRAARCHLSCRRPRRPGSCSSTSGWAGTAGSADAAGGEALTPTLADALLARERTVEHVRPHRNHDLVADRTASPSRTLAANAIPIGRPIRGTPRRLVLDRAANPLPVGASAASSTWAARGSRRATTSRPELTAQRFVPAPFDLSLRLYRTGDLVARRAAPGSGVFRQPRYQVKVRGFRIELGEIDNTPDPASASWCAAARRS